MNSTTFLQGISRVLNCPKVHVAAAGLVTTYFAVRYATVDLPPTQRTSIWVAFIGAVAVQLREIINAWTEEDVARVMNTSTAAAVATPAPAPTVAASTPAPLAAIPNSADSVSPPALLRSSTMPARTRLPLILMGFATIAFLTGCQPSPDLAIYREGLHQVDAPLYQAHLLLLDDAVKANLRADADRQVVKQGITAAEALYQQSKGVAPAPATRP